MNGYQRIHQMLTTGRSDCHPLMPITMMFAADQFGVSYRQYVTDYNTLVAAQVHTARKFGFDYVSVISDPAREAADTGAAVHFYDDQPPALDEMVSLLHDKTRLDTLEKPSPSRKGSRMWDRVCAVQQFAETVKHDLWIEGWVEGPCAEAADLRGINRLMLDFADSPEFVRRLFGWCVELALDFAQAQIQAGADMIGIGDAAASLVGPRIYREFVLPYEKQLIDGIHKMGGKVRLHICGNISRSLADVATLGADMVDLDWMVPIDKARTELGPLQVIAGNIDPVHVLRNGSPADITAALTKCYTDVAKTRYIVAAGCEVPRDTPLQNIESLCSFAKGGCGP